jgi:hypothetical protein
LDNLPRQDAAMQRATISKLFKDYERLKVSLEGIVSESQLIKFQPGLSGGGATSTPQRVDHYSRDQQRDEQQQQQQFQKQLQLKQEQIQLKPTILMQDIDEIIIAERERDIQKINEDLFMVNDMFE